MKVHKLISNVTSELNSHIKCSLNLVILVLHYKVGVQMQINKDIYIDVALWSLFIIHTKAKKRKEKIQLLAQGQW